MRVGAMILVALAFVMGTPVASANSTDLSNGVFIAHAPSTLQYSSDPPGGSWCAAYSACAIDSCSEQDNRIDSQGMAVWYVLCAWSEAKEWCGTEFGLGDYDDEAFVIEQHGPCFPSAGLTIPTSGWPGPGEGIALTTPDSTWTGNFQPVYWFAGYAYAEDVISLSPSPASGFGGWAECEGLEEFAAADFGGMGLLDSGVYACPDGPLGGEDELGSECGDQPEVHQGEADWGAEFGMVFDCMKFQEGCACQDDRLKDVMEKWLGSDNTEWRQESSDPDPVDPYARAILFENWQTYIPLSDDISYMTHGDNKSGRFWLCLEYHYSREQVEARIDEVQGLLPGCDNTCINGGPVGPYEWPGLLISAEGMAAHLIPTLVDAGDVYYAGACSSCATYAGLSLDNCASFLCYDYIVPSNVACDDIDQMMECLGCEMPVETQVNPDAWTCWLTQDVTISHRPASIPSCGPFGLARGGSYGGAMQVCQLVDAQYGDLYACETEILFRTTRERSCLVHLLQGTDAPRPSAADEWTTLARVSPHNAAARTCTYLVSGVPPHRWYRVVSLETGGRCDVSAVFTQGRRPSEWDAWIAASDVVRKPLRTEQAPEVCELRGAGLAPFAWTRDGSGPGGREDDLDPDSSLCADVVAYTSALGYSMSFLARFVSHMQHYPWLKVRYVVGGTDLQDAAVACASVHAANCAYNAQSGTDRFPTEFTHRRPLLVILGDSNPLVVGHLETADLDSLCDCEAGVPCCPADRLVWDVHGTGSWIGLVHRIPANEYEELDRACTAAEQWNAGAAQYVDPNRRVIMCVGDYGPMAQQYTMEVALYSRERLALHGYEPYEILLESDYTPLCNDPEKHQAYRGLLESGAVMDWGFGEWVGPTHWPGYFLSFPDTFPTAPQQRLVAIQSGCHSVSVASADSVAPFVEGWMFNDLGSTVLTGVVGHLSGGWIHMEEMAQRLYLDGWLSLCEVQGSGLAEYPLDWVVLYAAGEARMQGVDLLEQYLLSAETMGAYVMAHPGGQCQLEQGVIEERDLERRVYLEATATPSRWPSFRLASGGGVEATVKVYDSCGRYMSTVWDGALPAGASYRTWLGVSRDGKPAPSGVYFARLSAWGQELQVVRVVLIR